LERGVLYFLLHKEHGMLAWSDRAANTSIQKYDGRADDRVDIGSLVRILRGNDLLTGTPYLRHCSRLDTAECHSKSAPW